LRYAHRYRGNKGAFEEHAFLQRVAADAAPSTSDEHVGFRWAPAQETAKAVRWPAHATALELALSAF
jgi:hypothetical protein